jgi:hypothetical protein
VCRPEISTFLLLRPIRPAKEGPMAKGQTKTNKEAKKPKKEVPKTIAANPSTKGVTIKK